MFRALMDVFHTEKFPIVRVTIACAFAFLTGIFSLVDLYRLNTDLFSYSFFHNFMVFGAIFAISLLLSVAVFLIVILYTSPRK